MIKKNEFNKEFKKYFEENNIEITLESRKRYLNENLDREKYCNKLDEDLFEKIKIIGGNF